MTLGVLFSEMGIMIMSPPVDSFEAVAKIHQSRICHFVTLLRQVISFLCASVRLSHRVLCALFDIILTVHLNVYPAHSKYIYE